MTTQNNLGKFGIKNGKSYEGKIGFDKNGDTCVKWYEIKGHKGCQIDSLFNKGQKVIFGKDVVAI